MKNETIYSEMGQTTNIDITYTCAYNGKLRVKTTKEFKGRGIKFAGRTDLNPRNIYYFTELAFKALKKNHDVCYEGLL